MKQHLGRQSGVQSVEVSLIDGKVDVTPKEGGQIEPAQLLKAVYDSGVTATEMDIIARGNIEKDSTGNLTFRISPKQSFAVEPNEQSKGIASLAGSQTMITVRGQVYKKPSGRKKADPSIPLKLLILEVQKKE